MKKAIPLLLILSGFITPASGQLLKNVYQTKKLPLKEQLRIGFDSLPKEVPLKRISGFAVTGNGNIFISDMGLHNLKVFNKEGKFLKAVGQQGNGPGDLNYPYHIASNGPNVYVCEIANRRISVFGQQGNFIKFKKSKILSNIDKIKGLPSGDLLVQKEVPNWGLNIGQEKIIYWFTADLVLKKKIYQHHVLRNKFIREPVKMNLPQPFQPTVAWDISRKGLLCLGFGDKYAIEIYHLDKGKISEFTHSHTPVRVTEQEKKALFAGMTFSSSDGGYAKGAPNYVRKNTQFPGFKPAYTSIVVDYQDNILVFPSQSEGSEDIIFDAFTPRGKFISSVKLKKNQINPSRMFFKKGFLWSTAVMQDDEVVLIKYAVTPHL